MDNELKNRFITAKRRLFDKLYSHLNDAQREAVFSVKQPLLVLAGAGTGKTTVLVNRISHIIRFGNSYYSDYMPEGMDINEIQKLEDSVNLSNEEIAEVLADCSSFPCPPWNILCITFTNKAANEMKERLAGMLGEDIASSVWAGTFHSVCLKILRKFGSSIGYSSNCTIYDTDDTKKCILSCMQELNIDDKKFNVKSVINEISSYKNMLKTAGQAATEALDFRSQMICKIYSLYEQKLKAANALDFDDIIMQTVNLLQTDDEAREYCQKKFRYVSVDEFQDTNYAQLVLCQLLSAGYNNIMVVGDDDQSIYKFRGATIENILNFDKLYPEAKIVRLEENYRSTSRILNAANAIIDNNVGRHKKTLYSKLGDGEKIVVKNTDNQIDESRYIVNKITELVVKEHRKYSDFAVLYRMNSQSNAIEQVMARSGIPHRIIGGTRFYERKEIKDIMAYLCVISNQNDDLRLKRIINEPKRKIGEKLVQDIETLAQIEGKSMFEIISSAALYPQICKYKEKLEQFSAIIENLKQIKATSPLSVLFENTIKLTGYEEMLILGGEAEADRLQNVHELITNALTFEESRENPTLEDFLEEVSLVSDIDNYDDESNSVVLMTVHSAKGLEFPVVFLPGAEEGIFPSSMAIDENNIEEERRLAYVAVTRAKEKLYIITAKERMIFGRTEFNPPSRFLSEIPGSLITTDNNDRANIHDNQGTYKRGNKAPANVSSRSSLFAENKATKSAATFTVGARVVHSVFGSGTIISAKSLGADVLYEIAFDTVGTKKLMATYAKLKPEE